MSLRSKMLPNSSAVFICPSALMVAVICCPWLLGKSPNAPTDNCAFCAEMAAVTSAKEML